MNGAAQPPRSDRPTEPGILTRRAAIGLGAAALAGAAIGVDTGRPADARTAKAAGDTDDRPPTALEVLRPDITPRDAWGADLPAVGPILPEDDVQFLLVHHTASTNDYGPDEVADQIRGFHSYHTGPEKGWPDVAYNFFVDRFGGVWEARAGSIAGPVRGDATGGSQGFALLCSLIGDHSRVPVPPETRASLVRLLAWLAERHGIATEPGSTVDFVSRGSNRWPAGAPVTATTIAGHRDMSETTCPGDFAYDLIAAYLPRAVTDLRAGAVATVAAATPTTGASAPAPEPVTPSTDPTETSSIPAADEAESAVTGLDGGSDGGPLDGVTGPAVVAGGVAAVGAAALAARRDRRA